MQTDKLSFGLGDRFGLEGKAQLRAVQEINRLGFPVVPVWNKSNREHELVGTTQKDVRTEADEAVRANGWHGNYHVDADHITLENVDKFLDHSDFFTIDVANFIGKPVSYLGFCRVDIDIDDGGVHVQKKDGDGITTNHQKGVIRLQ